jgi:hypothetical protein
MSIFQDQATQLALKRSLKPLRYLNDIKEVENALHMTGLSD